MAKLAIKLGKIVSVLSLIITVMNVNYVCMFFNLQSKFTKLAELFGGF
jgi:cyclic lactone autoinducer peptide